MDQIWSGLREHIARGPFALLRRLLIESAWSEPSAEVLIGTSI
jgi:hypothetical protein